METALALRSYHCTVGTVLGASGRLIPSQWERKRLLLQSIKSSEASLAVTSDSIPSNSSTKGPVEKKTLQTSTFPNAFESLVMEVCDETDVAELNVKVGGFEMHLKRNVGAVQVQSYAVSSHSTAPDVPTKPMVESLSAVPAPTESSKPEPKSNSPFLNASLSSKAAMLTSLEGSGNAYVLVSSPTVGIFRRGRTIKDKKQPPICKEGDIVKEGQVIGYLDQFGSELPVKSDVAGEVLKLLYKDGEAVGYGDPLVAILPSFSGIN